MARCLGFLLVSSLLFGVSISLNLVLLCSSQWINAFPWGRMKMIKVEHCFLTDTNLTPSSPRGTLSFPVLWVWTWPMTSFISLHLFQVSIHQGLHPSCHLLSHLLIFEPVRELLLPFSVRGLSPSGQSSIFTLELLILPVLHSHLKSLNLAS